MAAPVTPVAPDKINATEVATDVTKYGGVIVAIAEVVENAFPAVSVPATYQAVIAAVIAVVTSFLALSKQKAVVAAAAGVRK